MERGIARNGEVEIVYEVLGNSEDETIIFISGLGSQLVFWTDEFCERFLSRGFQVIRFDNRDVGLTSKTAGKPPAVAELMAGNDISAPYTFSDMAADTVAVLDAVGVTQAHVVGTSLGGGIAQTVAIEYPERVKTLTSVMSAASLGSSVRDEREDDAAREEAVAASLTMDMSDPATYVETQVEGWRVTSGPHFDADYQRAILQRSFDRCYHPDGWAFQMMAAVASGDRTEKLGALKMPVLVIHGGIDPLVPPAGGRGTAAAIPGSRYLEIADMGHNYPRPRWDEIAEAIEALARGA